MPVSKALVSRRNIAAARALCSAIGADASCVPSMRCKATRLPPESATAIASFQSRFFDSATAAAIAACAFSSDIGGPYGTSNGILSGTLSSGYGAGACCAWVMPAPSNVLASAIVKAVLTGMLVLLLGTERIQRKVYFSREQAPPCPSSRPRRANSDPAGTLIHEEEV